MPILPVVLSAGALARISTAAQASGSTDAASYVFKVLRGLAVSTARTQAVSNANALASQAADAAESSALADFAST